MIVFILWRSFKAQQHTLFLKNHHTRDCPVYVFDTRLLDSISGIRRWETLSLAGIYIGYSPFHAGSVALVMNPETGNVSPQFHVVFDAKFSKVLFMREVTKTPNWTDLVKHRSPSGAIDNIDL